MKYFRKFGSFIINFSYFIYAFVRIDQIKKIRQTLLYEIVHRKVVSASLAPTCVNLQLN